MRYIKTIDDITKDGQVTFGDGYEFVTEAEKADAILMRSTDLHGYELPESIRAIARCGAGVNNIPIEEYAKKGVVVFNSPGANSNAVKELVLAMLVLSSRGVGLRIKRKIGIAGHPLAKFSALQGRRVPDFRPLQNPGRGTGNLAGMGRITRERQCFADRTLQQICLRR